jgi:hypothetical protein
LGKIALTFLANDHAAFDADWAKLARWADIGQNLLWGFVQGRDYNKLRQHGKPAEKWLSYSTSELTRAPTNLLRLDPILPLNVANQTVRAAEARLGGSHRRAIL